VTSLSSISLPPAKSKIFIAPNDLRYLIQKERETIMEKTVLIAYASKYGATAGIAEKIGEVLGQEGLKTDVLQARRVSDVNIYGAVVIGSGVYMGQWLKGAAALLRDHEQALSQRPVWLFSDGPTGEGDPSALTQGFRFPEKLKPVADRIQPRDIAFFHGMIDPTKISFLKRWPSKPSKPWPVIFGIGPPSWLGRKRSRKH
jgi:menaquinone-dependent protoporphyrinogen oxidase